MHEFFFFYDTHLRLLAKIDAVECAPQRALDRSTWKCRHREGPGSCKFVVKVAGIVGSIMTQNVWVWTLFFGCVWYTSCCGVTSVQRQAVYNTGALLLHQSICFLWRHTLHALAVYFGYLSTSTTTPSNMNVIESYNMYGMLGKLVCFLRLRHFCIFVFVAGCFAVFLVGWCGHQYTFEASRDFVNVLRMYNPRYDSDEM